MQEERNHAPYVSIGNQHKLMAYAEVTEALGQMRERLAPYIAKP